MQDLSFERLFRQTFVYNIIFEDTEVDERYFGIDDHSSVLAISGAGCGVANFVSQNARHIDAVDINKHHLALAALKATAAQEMDSHEEFYGMFGRGYHPDAKRATADITRHLPRWIQKYWKRHHARFDRTFIQQGMTTQGLRILRNITGMDAEWVRSLIPESPAERRRILEETVFPAFDIPWVKAIIESPLQLLGLGINYSQKNRLMETEETPSFVEYLKLYLSRLAETDVERNWFIWYASAGQYNHDTPDAVPPYLRPDHHANAVRSTTSVNYRNESIFKTLARGKSNTWTHYSLLDAVDWMPDTTRERLFDEILRTSVDGARVLYRSVEDDSIVERLGLERHFQLDVEASEAAARDDRTRQYRRVNFYDVVH